VLVEDMDPDALEKEVVLGLSASTKQVKAMWERVLAGDDDLGCVHLSTKAVKKLWRHPWKVDISEAVTSEAVTSEAVTIEAGGAPGDGGCTASGQEKGHVLCEWFALEQTPGMHESVHGDLRVQLFVAQREYPRENITLEEHGYQPTMEEQVLGALADESSDEEGGGEGYDGDGSSTGQPSALLTDAEREERYSLAMMITEDLEVTNPSTIQHILKAVFAFERLLAFPSRSGGKKSKQPWLVVLYENSRWSTTNGWTHTALRSTDPKRWSDGAGQRSWSIRRSEHFEDEEFADNLVMHMFGWMRAPQPPMHEELRPGSVHKGARASFDGHMRSSSGPSVKYVWNGPWRISTEEGVQDSDGWLYGKTFDAGPEEMVRFSHSHWRTVVRRRRWVRGIAPAATVGRPPVPDDEDDDFDESGLVDEHGPRHGALVEITEKQLIEAEEKKVTDEVQGSGEHKGGGGGPVGGKEPMDRRAIHRIVEAQTGDYQVRVDVIEARNLQGKDLGGTSDAVAYVHIGGEQCDEQQRNTRVHHAAGSCVFDEQFHFELEDLDPYSLASTMLTVKVYDHDTIKFNDLIGEFRVDLARVWARPGHQLHRQWVVLFNPERGMFANTAKRSGSQGYLLISVLVLGPGDPTPALNKPSIAASHCSVFGGKVGDEDHDEGSDGESANKFATAMQQYRNYGRSAGAELVNMLVPPQLPMELWFLVVGVAKAEGLPNMDWVLGHQMGIDAYVQIEFAGNPPVRTKVVHRRHQPLDVAFNQQFFLPVLLPSLGNSAKITILDRDTLDKDDLVATVHVNFDDLVADAEADSEDFDGEKIIDSRRCQWLNLYGAQRDSTALVYPNMAQKRAALMNQNSDRGSTYRGRILVSLGATRAAGRWQHLKQRLYQRLYRALQPPEDQVYELRAQLFMVCDFPPQLAKLRKEMSIEIHWGKYKYLHEECIANANNHGKTKHARGKAEEDLNLLTHLRVMYGPAGTTATHVEFPAIGTGQVPDVVICMCIRKRVVAYKRILAADVERNKFAYHPEWHQLQSDPSCKSSMALSVPLKPDTYAGNVLMAIGLGERLEWRALKRNKWPPRMPKMEEADGQEGGGKKGEEEKEENGETESEGNGEKETTNGFGGYFGGRRGEWARKAKEEKAKKEKAEEEKAEEEKAEEEKAEEEKAREEEEYFDSSSDDDGCEEWVEDEEQKLVLDDVWAKSDDEREWVTSHWELRVHLYQADDLPAKDRNGSLDPYAVLRFGGLQKSQCRKCTNSPSFYTSFTKRFEVRAMPMLMDGGSGGSSTLTFAPDIELTLMDEDWGKTDDFVGTMRMRAEQVDRVINCGDQGELPRGTLVEVRATLIDPEQEGVGTLTVKVCQARGLPAVDGSREKATSDPLKATSDPFVMVSRLSTSGSETVQTKVVSKSLEPVWDESFVLKIKDIAEVVTLKVMDKGTFSNTQMCEVALYVQDLAAESNTGDTSSTPTTARKWYKLKGRRSKGKTTNTLVELGEIEIEFEYEAQDPTLTEALRMIRGEVDEKAEKRSEVIDKIVHKKEKVGLISAEEMAAILEADRRLKADLGATVGQQQQQQQNSKRQRNAATKGPTAKKVWERAKVLETFPGSVRIKRSERKVVCKGGWYYVVLEDLELDDMVCRVRLEGEGGKKGQVAWVKYGEGMRLMAPTPVWHKLEPKEGLQNRVHMGHFMSKKQSTHHFWQHGAPTKQQTDWGKVLVSVEAIRIPDPDTWLPPCASIVPKKRPCMIEVYAHGLRGLQPLNMLPVSKPHLSLDLGLEFQQRPMTTAASNHPSGASPNFCQHMMIAASLPVDRLFWPKMNVKVYDHILGGLATPLIAHGTIELPGVLEDVRPVMYTHTEELWEYQHAPCEAIQGKWIMMNFGRGVSSFRSTSDDSKVDFRSFNRNFRDKHSGPAAGKAWEWTTKAPEEEALDAPANEKGPVNVSAAEEISEGESIFSAMGSSAGAVGVAVGSSPLDLLSTLGSLFTGDENLDGHAFGWELHQKMGAWRYGNNVDAKKWRKEGRQNRVFDKIRRRCWQRTREKQRFGHRRATSDNGPGHKVAEQQSERTVRIGARQSATLSAHDSAVTANGVGKGDVATGKEAPKTLVLPPCSEGVPPQLMELGSSPTIHESIRHFEAVTPPMATSADDSITSETLPLVVQTAQKSTDRAAPPSDSEFTITGKDVVTNMTDSNTHLPTASPKAALEQVECRTANATNLAALSQEEKDAEALKILGCSVNESIENICTRAAALEQYHVTGGGFMRDRVPPSVGGELGHLFESPAFETVTLYRGAQSSTKRRNNFRSVGKLKYLIRVVHTEDVELAAEEPLVDIDALKIPQKFVVRVYALRGLNLNAEQDSFGGCDPYVKMVLGSADCSARSRHLSLHGRNVGADSVPFYQLLELEANLPGESQLQVQVLDYDAIGSDDLMGQTVIDLEDYVFNKSWNSTHYMKHGPLTKGQKLWTLEHLNAIEFGDLLDEHTFSGLHTFMHRHGRDCALRFKERVLELTVQAIAIFGLYVNQMRPSPIPRGTHVEVMADGIESSSGSIWLKANVLETLPGTVRIPKSERRVLIKGGWYCVQVQSLRPRDFVCKVLLQDDGGAIAWVKCDDRLRLMDKRPSDIMVIARHKQQLVYQPKRPSAEEHEVRSMVQDLAKGMNGLGWVHEPDALSDDNEEELDYDKRKIRDMDNLGPGDPRVTTVEGGDKKGGDGGEGAKAEGATAFRLSKSKAAAAAAAAAKVALWKDRRMVILEALAKRLLMYEEQHIFLLNFDIGEDENNDEHQDKDKDEDGLEGAVEEEKSGERDGTPDELAIPPVLMELYEDCVNSITTGLPFKPVEERALYHPNKFSMHQQGSLEMWIDIIPQEIARCNPSQELTLPSIYAGELRVIVWGATQLKSLDTEGLNDAYVKVWLAEAEGSAHVTDTHWRSRRGKANWNYRMKFPVDVGARGRQEQRRIHFQVWDRDASSPSDLIGEQDLNLDPHMIMRDVIERGGGVDSSSGGSSTAAGVAGAASSLSDEDKEYSYFDHVRSVQRQVTALRAEQKRVHTELVDDDEVLTPEHRALLLEQKKAIAQRLERDPDLEENVFPRQAPFQRQIREAAQLLFPKKRKPAGHSFAMLERIQRRARHGIVGYSEEEPDWREEMLEDEEEPLLPGMTGAPPQPINERICAVVCKTAVWVLNQAFGLCIYLCFENAAADLQRFICRLMPPSIRNRHRLARFYVPLRAARNDNRANEEHGSYTGVLEVSLEWLPEAQTKVKLNGIAREEPNAHPFLPRPWGRVHWQWSNPFAVVYQMVGPDVCKLIVLGVLLYWIFAVMLPIFISQLMLKLMFY
jgi:hypothetical protein